MKNLLQRLLIKIVSKYSVYVGQLHAPWARKNVTGADYRQLVELIQVGDVLLSRTNGELGNLFIPGQFSHSAIYLGNRAIEESVGTGVRITDLVDFFMNKDIIAVVRPKFASGEDIDECLTYVLAQVGKPYNFDFKFSEHDEKHYCCELIYKGYTKAVPNSPFTLRKTLGIDTVIPDDFIQAEDKWEIIWESKSYKEIK